MTPAKERPPGPRILICPDKFKGSLSASQAATSIARGLRVGIPDASLDLCPLADGGEGTLEALLAATSGTSRVVRVAGPLGEGREAPLGTLGNSRTAVIEMASASGLALIPKDKLNPLMTTTFGTGQLIKAGLDQGIRDFIIGIGGSGTCDGGAGMAQALGVRFLDAQGRDLEPGGGSLRLLSRIDLSGLDARVAESTFTAASDVDNPLYGPEGAAAVYAPQKGASPEDIEVLDAGLYRLSRVVLNKTGKDLGDTAGAGAAGGLGFGLIAFLGAQLKSGVGVVMEAVSFKERLRTCQLALTGEGRLDAQTAHGKTVAGVAEMASSSGVTVIALAGEITGGLEELHRLGLTAAFSIQPGPVSLDIATSRASEYLETTAREMGRWMSATLASINR